jgi:hypothetical protein
MLVVFIEDAFCNSIRRPIEPALSFRFGLAEYPTCLPFRWVAPASYDFCFIEAYSDDSARTDICASPLPAAAPETSANYEV